MKFGHEACIQTVESVDEAIRPSNRTRYGLGATLWGCDSKEFEQKALSIEAGMIGVNHPFGGGAIPWYGTKESGFGFTGGILGMRSFLQPRSISVSR